MATPGAELVTAKWMNGISGTGQCNGNFYICCWPFQKWFHFRFIIKTVHRKKRIVPFSILLYDKRTKSTNLFISYSPATEKGYSVFTFMKQRDKGIGYTGMVVTPYGWLWINHPKIFVVQDFFDHFISSCHFAIFAKTKGEARFVVA